MLRGLLPFLSLLLLMGANLAHAMMGFWPVENAQIPASIRTAASSTYQILFPGVGSAPMKRKDVGLFLKLSDVADSTRSKVMTKLNLLEAELCLSNTNMDECVLSMQPVAGTLFTLQDGRVATTIHAIRPYIQRIMDLPSFRDLTANKKEKMIDDLPIPVLLCENGRWHSVILKVSKVLEDSFSAPSYYDGLLMTIEKGFNATQGLKLANTKVADAEIVYAIGAPAKTRDRNLLGVPDSPGHELRVTYGPKLSVDQFVSTLGGFESLEQEQREFLDQSVIAFYGDGYYGMSGGPILNSKGEVVGILNGTSVFQVNEANHTRYVSIGLCTDLLVRKAI